MGVIIISVSTDQNIYDVRVSHNKLRIITIMSVFLLQGR